jgi:hypothetical protein
MNYQELQPSDPARRSALALARALPALGKEPRSSTCLHSKRTATIHAPTVREQHHAGRSHDADILQWSHKPVTLVQISFNGQAHELFATRKPHIRILALLQLHLHATTQLHPELLRHQTTQFVHVQALRLPQDLPTHDQVSYHQLTSDTDIMLLVAACQINTTNLNAQLVHTFQVALVDLLGKQQLHAIEGRSRDRLLCMCSSIPMRAPTNSYIC